MIGSFNSRVSLLFLDFVDFVDFEFERERERVEIFNLNKIQNINIVVCRSVNLYLYHLYQS